MMNVSHDYQISSTLHGNQLHKIMEHTAELPLSQGGSLVDPCDKEELCDISLFTTSPQLDGEHTLVSCSAPNILQENENKSKLRPHIQNIIPQLPSYSVEFDPKA
jgi:hypothetical protein